MTRKTLVAVMLLVVGVGFLGLKTASAQNTTGNIVGTVNDSTGAVVSNATVTIVNKSTNDRRVTKTNESGDYQVLQLAPGEYRLDVDAKGFKHFTRNPVEVQVELATRVNIDLAVGSQNETVTVTDQAPIIQTENATLGQVVQGKAVSEMPLNGRNVLALVGLIPGVVPQGSSSGNLTGLNVFAAGNYQIGGGTANQSSTLYDGVPVNVSYGNATILVPSQDSVQEFRVQTSNNTAEYGNYTGGVINIASKSGSNAIHGTTYEYVRNTMFNATPYFARHNSNTAAWLPINPYHQNQFGANAGFPIIKDKLFGFFDYQGYRQMMAQPFAGGTASVPTAKMAAGDFSEWCTTGFDANGKCLPLSTGGYGTSKDQSQVAYQIYDPCTGTATPAGGACSGQSASTARTYFPNNKIPANRLSTVAQNLIKFPYWAAPNVSGPTNAGLSGNFHVYEKGGGTNDQYNGRVDFVASEKQRIFGRYTRWNSQGIGADPYHNGLINNDVVYPEGFKTNQMVLGDSYLFSTTLIGDLRLGWTRWNYVRKPGTLGYDPTKLGFPSYMSQISKLNNVANSTTIPTFKIANINPSYTGYIFSINNDYNIAPTVSKVWKTHTIKAGADLRRLEQVYFQSNYPGGLMNFDSVMTASTPNNQTTTGLGFASFMLGYLSGASLVQISNPTYYQVYYQGYYVQDNWVVTPKLTLNLGLRYEIPGVYRERHNLQSTFNPTETNSALGATSITLPDGTSKNVVGAFDLVATSQHPAAGLRNEHFVDFSPRIGAAYRINDKTVVRGGFGVFYVPSTLQFPESPVSSPNSFNNNNIVNTVNNNVSPNVNLDNPFPTGLIAPPGRSSGYQQSLLGSGVNALSPDEPNGLTYQWNVAIQRQFPMGIAVDASYAGLHGMNLPISTPINQVPNGVMAAAFADPTCNTGTTPTANCFFTKNVQNPFNRALFLQGTQMNATIAANQLFTPFPQYAGISNVGHYAGKSNYNALQLKVEKRFNSGGVLLGAYTFSKLMNNADGLTSWLETAGAANGVQNFYDLAHEYSLSGYDSRQRLVVSYVYQLPIGHNQRFASGVRGPLDKIISGFGVNGVTTLQEGFPIGLGTTTTNYNLAGSLRPNVVAGCNKKTSGAIQKRLGDIYSTSTYYNTACFTKPGLFTFGNESRQDNTMRNPGVANYDIAVFKDTQITEKLTLQLRVESFNAFNRVQFANPGTSIGSSSAGVISAQANNPRTFQLAGRFNF